MLRPFGASRPVREPPIPSKPTGSDAARVVNGPVREETYAPGRERNNRHRNHETREHDR
jgi:hypothetical protein